MRAGPRPWGVVAAIAVLLAVPAARAQTPTTDVYRTSIGVTGRDSSRWVVTVTVTDGTERVVKVQLRPRCNGCKVKTYQRILESGEFSSAPVVGTECACESMTVATKFGGKRFSIEWLWDVEPGMGGTTPAWTAVTAANLLNVSCYGEGTKNSSLDPLGQSGGGVDVAKPFPAKLPSAFAKAFPGPRCTSTTPR